MAYQGIFKPRNPHKYKGDVNNIIYRSSWELRLMSYLDKHDEVIQWGSEEVVIPYVSPHDNRKHRYFVDFVVKKRGPNGNTEVILIEVKPKAQTRPPEIPKRKTKRFIDEVYAWGVNQAKWAAAEEYCKNRGWTFQIFTENELGIK